MALNIITDKTFDDTIEWLSHKEKKTKSQIIRELVFKAYEHKTVGPRFGALSHLFTSKKYSSQKKIAALLKEIDNDDDLD
jgi:hypothetical protein